MKVLKKGRRQTGWADEFLCTGKGNKDGGCHAELLVEHGDLFLTYSQHQGESDTFVTFRCSECGVLTDISNNQAPKVTAEDPGPTEDGLTVGDSRSERRQSLNDIWYRWIKNNPEEVRKIAGQRVAFDPITETVAAHGDTLAEVLRLLRKDDQKPGNFFFSVVGSEK